MVNCLAGTRALEEPGGQAARQTLERVFRMFILLGEVGDNGDEEAIVVVREIGTKSGLILARDGRCFLGEHAIFIGERNEDLQKGEKPRV